MGNSSGSRPRSDSFNSSIGSGRFGAGFHFAWEVRGTFSRKALPPAMRCFTVGPSKVDAPRALAASLSRSDFVPMSLMFFTDPCYQLFASPRLPFRRSWETSAILRLNLRARQGQRRPSEFPYGIKKECSERERSEG